MGMMGSIGAAIMPRGPAPRQIFMNSILCQSHVRPRATNTFVRLEWMFTMFTPAYKSPRYFATQCHRDSLGDELVYGIELT